MAWAKFTRVSAVVTTDVGDLLIQPHEGKAATLLMKLGDSAMFEIDAGDLLEAVEAMARESGLQGMGEE